MKKYIFAVLALLFFSFGLAGSVHAAEGWSKFKDRDGIKSYVRAVPGTDLKEYLAVTTIDAKMEVIGEVLRDVPAFGQWMPDFEDAKIEKQYDRNTFVLHLILSPLMIQQRDIVLKDKSIYDYENGNARINFFCTDDVKIPVAKNRTRITVMNGLYQMDYIGRNKTRFVYKLKVDPAGNIPKALAYSVMKEYPAKTLKKMKEVVKNKKYADAARNTDEEKQINDRSTNEVVVKKILSNHLMKVVKNKALLSGIMDAEKEGIKQIALSGSSYDAVEKTARDICTKYVEGIVADKNMADKLRENKKLTDELTELLTMHCEASEETIDSVVAKYVK